MTREEEDSWSRVHAAAAVARGIESFLEGSRVVGAAVASGAEVAHAQDFGPSRVGLAGRQVRCDGDQQNQEEGGPRRHRSHLRLHATWGQIIQPTSIKCIIAGAAGKGGRAAGPGWNGREGALLFMGCNQFLQAVDPAELRKAQQRSAGFNERYGAEIRRVREAAGILQFLGASRCFGMSYACESR